MVDLHAHQAVTDARMAEDRLRAERARQRPHAARDGRRARTYWPELLHRLTRPRAARRATTLRQVA